jgi:hypothetical protein
MEATGMFRVLSVALVSITNMIAVRTAVAQESANIVIENAVVRAGETVRFVVTVDRPPNIDDCNILWYIGDADGATQSGVALPRGQTKATIEYKVPFDATGGRYALQKLVFSTPSTRQIPLTAKPVYFDVIANTGIQLPSSASVVIQPSQIQLFRTQALALAKRVQELKGSARLLQSKGQGAISAELRKAVSIELAAIKQTDEAFRSLGGDAQLLETARVFFADLSLSYRKTQANLRADMVGPRKARKGSILANGFFAPEQSATGDAVSYLSQEALYRAAEQNELAYNLVANTGNLSFDLTIISSPSGAAIKYGRRGDELKDHADPTKAILQSLPLAIWRIHFHKEGFQDQEREFNPFTEHEKLVDVTLQPTRK